MRCPQCGSDATRVIDSRAQESSNSIKRRRLCRSCGFRFTTFERYEDPIEVRKRDGSVEPFDRGKLLSGLMRATAKREVDIDELNLLIDDIEQELRARTFRTVSSHDIGDMVLKRLEKIDKVAYVRFASVYRDFQSVEEFFDELEKLR